MEKYKVYLKYLGVTLGIYISFKYILPCVAPFVFGMLIAVLIEKPVAYMEKHKVKRCIGSTLLVSISGILLGTVVVMLGYKLYNQGKLLLDNYQDVITKYAGKIKEIATNMAPDIIGKSIPAITGVIGVLCVTIITLIAAVLCSVSLPHIKKVVHNWQVGEYITNVYKRTMHVAAVYIRTQFIIMAITAVICSIVFYGIGNPYGLLIGTGIGVLDALPLFGSGIILVPWSLIYIIKKDMIKGAIVFTLFAVCYIVRQVLEPKLMGDKLGISGLEILVSIYAGVVLFGLGGFILGPIGYVLIREIGNVKEAIEA